MAGAIDQPDERLDKIELGSEHETRLFARFDESVSSPFRDSSPLRYVEACLKGLLV